MRPRWDRSGLKSLRKALGGSADSRLSTAICLHGQHGCRCRCPCLLRLATISSAKRRLAWTKFVTSATHIQIALVATPTISQLDCYFTTATFLVSLHLTPDPGRHHTVASGPQTHLLAAGKQLCCDLCSCDRNFRLAPSPPRPFLLRIPIPPCDHQCSCGRNHFPAGGPPWWRTNPA